MSQKDIEIYTDMQNLMISFTFWEFETWNIHDMSWNGDSLIQSCLI